MIEIKPTITAEMYATYGKLLHDLWPIKRLIKWRLDGHKGCIPVPTATEAGMDVSINLHKQYFYCTNMAKFIGKLVRALRAMAGLEPFTTVMDGFDEWAGLNPILARQLANITGPNGIENCADRPFQI